jgi:signal transduction histidine kinase
MSEDVPQLSDALLERASASTSPSDRLARARDAAAAVRLEGADALGDLLDQLVEEIEEAREQAEGARVHAMRLGLDLHDGAMQDLVAMRDDLLLFRGQIATALAESRDRDRAAGRVDDFIARVADLNASLRQIALASAATWALERPLSATLASLAEAKGTQPAVQLALDPDLDSSDLTNEQRVTLIRVVQSALANVRQHSEASSAVVTVRTSAGALDAEIWDDGRGFDLEAALRHADENGRLGLVGMRHRARVAGGDLTVESRPGGPTRLALHLPGACPR